MAELFDSGARWGEEGETSLGSRWEKLRAESVAKFRNCSRLKKKDDWGKISAVGIRLTYIILPWSVKAAYAEGFIKSLS